jgi:UDP-N-acetylenolpyruvoylglucosamine reductase
VLLMTLAQDEVRTRFGVELHAEVKLVGRWSS